MTDLIRCRFVIADDHGWKWLNYCSFSNFSRM